MMSGLDGSGAVHTVLTWEAFGGHVPPGCSEMTSLIPYIYFERYMPQARSRLPRWTPMRRNGPLHISHVHISLESGPLENAGGSCFLRTLEYTR
jgi:hypothetical protein